MIYDDGSGFDYPLFKKDNKCLFETYEGFVIRQKGKGDIKKYGKIIDKEKFFNEFIENGWEKIEL